jgi:hypothetical protein
MIGRHDRGNASCVLEFCTTVIGDAAAAAQFCGQVRAACVETTYNWSQRFVHLEMITHVVYLDAKENPHFILISCYDIYEMISDTNSTSAETRQTTTK